MIRLEELGLLPASPAAAFDMLAGARAATPAFLDPANWPGLTPDFELGDLPAPGVLAAGSPTELVRWALGRWLLLVALHPAWGETPVTATLAPHAADPGAMPLTSRCTLAALLELHNPPWAPAAQLLRERTLAAIGRQGKAVHGALVGEFGAAMPEALYTAEPAVVAEIIGRALRICAPEDVVAAQLRELRPIARRLRRNPIMPYSQREFGR